MSAPLPCRRGCRGALVGGDARALRSRGAGCWRSAGAIPPGTTAPALEEGCAGGPEMSLDHVVPFGFRVLAGEGTRVRAGLGVRRRARDLPGTSGLLRSAAVGGEHLGHPGALAGREHAVAGVEGVVHVVADRVEAGQRAGVAADRAAARGAALRRRVGDLVVPRRAAALERVVEPEPVPGLVGRGLAAVEVRRRATRQRGEVDPDAVDARVARVVPRERRDPEVRRSPRSRCSARWRHPCGSGRGTSCSAGPGATVLLKNRSVPASVNVKPVFAAAVDSPPPNVVLSTVIWRLIWLVGHVALAVRGRPSRARRPGTAPPSVAAALRLSPRAARRAEVSRAMRPCSAALMARVSASRRAGRARWCRRSGTTRPRRARSWRPGRALRGPVRARGLRRTGVRRPRRGCCMRNPPW